jgi:AraC-like DNA-binding protein
MSGYKMRRVEERWGQPFWSVVAQFAEQGLSRKAVAQALGYAPNYFTQLLARHPEQDPFETFGNVLAYVKDTGEGFEAALRRMAAAGYHISRAAREFGYKRSDHLRTAMRLRGISVEFARCPRSARCKVVQEFESQCGETVPAAVRRMRGDGHSWSFIARKIGYARGRSVKLALASLGVSDDFETPFYVGGAVG